MCRAFSLDSETPLVFSHQKYTVTTMANVGGDPRDCALGKRRAQMQVHVQFAEQAAQILARRHAADRPGQDVVEHQRRNAELGQRPAQRLLHRAVHAPAHEHAAALDVHGAHRIRKQHDRQDEPGSGLADEPLSFATGVIRRRSQIVQDDRRRPPERNERQKRRRGNNDARDTVATAACGSRASWSAAHVWVRLICRLKCSHFSHAKSSDGRKSFARKCWVFGALGLASLGC